MNAVIPVVRQPDMLGFVHAIFLRISRMLDKQELLRFIKLLRDNNLLTRSKTNEIVLNRYEAGDDENIKFIITSGEPTGTKECSECRYEKHESEFSYYQTRVSGKGYLMRANALCGDCSKTLNSERSLVLDNIDTPLEAPSDLICPECNRKWPGQWHRDHDYKNNVFRGVICGNCNMGKQDRRNPAGN